MANSTNAGGGAEIYVTKLGAARRQIDAAIRMLLANEDSLAIHTVTAAAYTVLRDLLKHRGRYDLEELLKAGIYRSALEYAEGLVAREQLDVFYKGDNLSQEIIINIAKEIREGRVSSPEEMKIEISIGEAWRKKYKQDLAEISNFLKHADRDPHESMKINQVDYIELLSHAASAFAMLTKELTNEMRVIMYLQRASMIKKTGYPGNKIEEHLAGLPESQRLEAGKKLLNIFRAED